MELLELTFAADVFEVVVDFVAEHAHFLSLSFFDRVEAAALRRINWDDRSVGDQQHKLMLASIAEGVINFSEHKAINLI